MSLKAKLVEATPRETAGAVSANRLDFQMDWALGHMLDLHLKDKDYRVLFDYHDDVVVLEPADDPIAIHFYQVKTRQGGKITRNFLTKRKSAKGGKRPSILGKLLLNQEAFEKETQSLNLVSNVPYKLELCGGQDSAKRNHICLHRVAKKELDCIREAIMEELGRPLSCETDDICFFHVTSLSLQDHSVHITGRLSQFLDTLYPNKVISPTVLYKTLHGEIKRRTTHEAGPTTGDELFLEKSLSRSDVTTMLKSINTRVSLQEIWPTLDNVLRTEGTAFTTIAEIRTECSRYLIERMDPTNTHLRKLGEVISTLINEHFAVKHSWSRITDLVDCICNDLRKIKFSFALDMSESTWVAIILVIAHEKGKI